ncbi:MAG: type II/IV secretion system protein [bacterium]|nr:type II/IV secretion system protein [bacterium]
MNQSESVPQLIRLFHAAGLVGETEYKAYAQSHAKHKPILDVLTQEVSLDSFRDLLNAEITFKRARFGSTFDTAMHQGLTSSAIINDDELREMLTIHRPPLPALIDPLRADRVLDEATAAEAIEKAAALDQPHEWLIDQGLISAGAVNQWLARLDSTKMRQGTLFVSMHILQYNRLLTEDDFLNLLKRLNSEGAIATLRQLETQGFTSSRLARTIEEGLEVPRIRIEEMETEPRHFGLFPQSWIRRQILAPFFEDPTAIGAATADPLNGALAGLVHWLTGRWIHLYFSPSGLIIDKINDFYRGERPQAESALLPPEAERAEAPGPLQPAPAKSGRGGRRKTTAAKAAAATAAPAAPESPAVAAAAAATPLSTRARIETELLADTSSAVQLVSSLIESAVELRATDIHIEPIREGLAVRYRIDGELHRILTVPPRLSQPVVSRVKVLADMDVTERRRPQDGHFALTVENTSFDFRISSLPAIQGEKLVIRILEPSRVLKGLNELGLLAKQQKSLEWMITQPYGMILVTGPTGSGKTSTLYSAMNILNRENRNLVTIEDPVEYQLQGINQVQVDPHIGLTFSEGLRSILRQDPDIIMVGEIRDADTARNAIRAAMTGHLVLSTLHTNTALGSVDALVHLGAVPFMVAGSLLGIVAQRLVRVLCPECRKAQVLGESRASQLGLPKTAARKKVYGPVGCDACLGSGYFGRTGVFEVISVNEKFRPLIATHHPQEQLEAAVRKDKVMSLFEAGVQKVLDGTTSMDELAEKIMLEI